MTKTALFALLALWGVGLGSALPARAEDQTDGSPAGIKATADTAIPGLVNRVWQQTDSDELPGVIRIFLSDGTLVMDSCWETHRLSAWKLVDDGKLSWTEDGTDISARVAALTDDTLTLVLELKGGAVEEHYAAAPVPSVCPDMPRA
jgi:hypothetical protein